MVSDLTGSVFAAVETEIWNCGIQSTLWNCQRL